MGSAKFVKKAAVGLLTLSIVALVGFNIYQHQQIKKVVQVSSGNISTNNETADKMQDKVPAVSKGTVSEGIGKSSGNSDAETLAYQINAAREELEMARKQLADQEAKKAEQAKIQDELQKKITEDPANKNSLRKFRKEYIEKAYALLFKELNLSLENKEKLEEILIDEEEASVKTTIVSRSGNMTIAGAESVDPGDEYQNRIRELLGAKDYATYQPFKEKSGEAYRVATFNESLGSDDAMTDDQQKALIDAMYKGNERIKAEEGDINLDIENINEEKISGYIKKIDYIDEVYITAAKDILTGSQLERFKARYKEQRDEQEANLKLMLKMRQAQTTQTGDEKGAE
jgi:hypothetical protein